MKTECDSKPTLAIVVAMDNNRGIGKGNQLLWHIPEDLQHFKRLTMNKPLIMGRKTFESIGRPLPGRLSVVITQQPDWQFDGVEVAYSFEQAVSIASSYINKNHREKDSSTNEIMVVGGGQIYALALPMVERIYLTQVDVSLEADTFFPSIDSKTWRLLTESPMMKAKMGYSFQYKSFEHI